ncbi:GmrSD restriction endonuclease domain-containing protein [Phytohabitans suffuscus]|uniref:GmrSD restriction endonuclease domain-containing protein n=1 Tax=Phytohabitans suffuscus TaxID=624315 RepID=UPI001E2921C3|nr:DUF262 domain-containing protein [Phytohabitans suffuscus]
MERTERSVREILDQVSRREIMLPELQRDYVWKPTQVAKLVDSLYRGYPSGALLFWEAQEAPVTRELAITPTSSRYFRAPLYLLDGQQRLTSLHRVFTGHPQAQIVFHLEQERFQNQSAATRADPKWIAVAEILRPEVGLLSLASRLRKAGVTLDDIEIERRLLRVKQLGERPFHMEVLSGFSYDEIAEIFVRVNSGGRHLGTLDLAMATLSARWPGVLEKLQKEADHWRRKGYVDIDPNFLSRALAGVVLGRGLSAWSHGQLVKATDEELQGGWETVQRGLRRLIPLLASDLGVNRSDVLPSMAALIPLVVLLGEWPDKRMSKGTGNAILYWLLVATIRARYSGSTDTRLSQDIRAARQPDPIKALYKNLDVFQSRPQITPQSLAGRTRESPYFFLSLLVAQRAGGTDWWHGIRVMPGFEGQHKIEHHHIHPVASLDERFDKAEINDLANLAFISARANKKISDRSPADYFTELTEAELRAHFIPTDEGLRTADAFPGFLAARRQLLADAMTELLDSFRPEWLDRLPEAPASTMDGQTLTLTLHSSAWDAGQMVFTATGAGISWRGVASMAELERAVADAVAGIDGDVEISGESVPVQVVEDAIEIPIGPYLVTGTAEEWLQVFERERSSARPPSMSGPQLDKPWIGERARYPITSTD